MKKTFFITFKSNLVFVNFCNLQVKKLGEKLQKCRGDVENAREKYTAALHDLNGYNPKYIEEMTFVSYKIFLFFLPTLLSLLPFILLSLSLSLIR